MLTFSDFVRCLCVGTENSGTSRSNRGVNPGEWTILLKRGLENNANPQQKNVFSLRIKLNNINLTQFVVSFLTTLC
jgi:hypothetical protein